MYHEKKRLQDEIDGLKKQLAKARDITSLEKKIENFGNPEKLSQKEQIDLEYAKKDIARSEEQSIRIKKRISVLKGEITKYRNRLRDLEADVSPIEEDSSIELPSE